MNIVPGTLKHSVGEIGSAYMMFVAAQTGVKSGMNVAQGRDSIMTWNELGDIAMHSAIMLGTIKLTYALFGPELAKIENQIARNQVNSLNAKVDEYAKTLTGGQKEQTISVLKYKLDLYKTAFKDLKAAPTEVQKYIKRLQSTYNKIQTPQRITIEMIEKAKRISKFDTKKSTNINMPRYELINKTGYSWEIIPMKKDISNNQQNSRILLTDFTPSKIAK